MIGFLPEVSTGVENILPPTSQVLATFKILPMYTQVPVIEHLSERPLKPPWNVLTSSDGVLRPEVTQEPTFAPNGQVTGIPQHFRREPPGGRNIKMPYSPQSKPGSIPYLLTFPSTSCCSRCLPQGV